ncbi:MAG: right-handed parallel beta-helix repeat-containing protein, partial [Pseudomonadota bacterium]
MKRNIWTMVAFASFAVAGVATALWTAPAAATELVDNDKVQCPTAEHTTIQAGVDAASPGELVLVCDGVYREAVRIFGPGKDGVRLRAKVVHGATIKAPAGYSGTGSGGTSPGPNNTGAIVLVQEDEVEVSGFRIVGPFTGLSGSGCPEHPNEDGFGVLVTNGAVGVKVLNNFIHQIADQSAGLCDFDGFGVGVSGEARVVIGNNRIQDYRNFGVLASGENTFVLVHHNEIIGGAVNQDALFPRSVAQVGVSVSGAQADVNANVITKNLGPTDVVNESAGVIVGGGAVNV